MKVLVAISFDLNSRVWILLVHFDFDDRVQLLLSVRLLDLFVVWCIFRWSVRELRYLVMQ